MADAESWVRAPRQARSQETMDRFVQATTELLQERSFEEITVADIVARAGRTVGSFYARFDDKHAVLHLLIEQLHARARDVTRAFCDPVRWDGSPVSEFVAESVRLNVQAYRRAGPLFHAALVASATDERFRQRRLDTLRACADLQKAFLLGRSDELSCAMPARAADRAFELLVARLDHELLFGRFTATSPASDLELVDELSDACLHVLGLQPAATGSSHDVPVAAI